MEKHGLVTWGDTSEDCYAQTIQVINEAEAFIEARVNEEKLFGGAKYAAACLRCTQQAWLLQVMPVIRGAVSDAKKMILSFDDQDDVLEFVGGKDSAKAVPSRRSLPRSSGSYENCASLHRLDT